MRTMVRPTSFGLLGGVTRTHPGRPVGPAEWVPLSYWLKQLQNTKINTTVRAFQTKHVFWSRMPHCVGPLISAFRNLYKHNLCAGSINALKANDIHDYIQNHQSNIIMIPQKWKYYIYKYIHIHELTIRSLAIPRWKRCHSAYNARANNCHRYRIFQYDVLFLFIYFMGVDHTHK